MKIIEGFRSIHLQFPAHGMPGKKLPDISKNGRAKCSFIVKTIKVVKKIGLSL
jgi:hypothetical protein